MKYEITEQELLDFKVLAIGPHYHSPAGLQNEVSKLVEEIRKHPIKKIKLPKQETANSSSYPRNEY